MRHFPRLALAAFATVAIIACGPVASAGPDGGDSWGVRVLGQGSGRSVESLSDVNTGKPARTTPVDPRPIATRANGSLSLQLFADGATATVLQASTASFAPELDRAMAWLARLQPPPQRQVRIVLTLVDPALHARVRRLHPVAEGMVIDLLVPLAPATAPQRSAAVGKALAIALHEASHAFAANTIDDDRNRKPLSRRDDEYRASLVESCYLVDTLRVGDNLQLRPRPGADADEYFVTAQSRDAARDVVRDLVRAAGTSDVRWNDATALLGLRLACAIRLARV